MRKDKKRAYKKRRILLEVVVIVALFFLIMHFYKDRDTAVFSDSFDLRQADLYSYVTPVKDQKVAFQWWNNLDADWAFAGLASFESSLLKQKVNSQPKAPQSNFSAWHLATHAKYNDPQYTFNAETNPLSDPPTPLGYNTLESDAGWGGSLLFAIDYFMRTPGPVLERDAPWPVKKMKAKRTLSPPVDRATAPVMLRKGLVFRAENYHNLSFYRSTIKRALSSHGAIATMMYMGQGDWPGQQGETFWRGDKYLDYYCDKASLADKANHAVTLIGWDDSREISGAPGKGAWLVKDSLGADWHDAGFFWISYFDRAFLSSHSFAAQLIGQSADGYDWPRYETHSGALSKIYDEQGNEVWGYQTAGFSQEKRDSWGLAQFKSKNDGQLKAIGIMTVNRNEQVTFNIYGRWNSETNSPEDLLYTQTNGFPEEGYHVVELNEVVPLWRDQPFIVAAGYAYRSEAKQEPLVVVTDPTLSIEPQRTFFSSSSATTGFDQWQDLATASDEGGKIFYLQAITQSNVSETTRF